MAPRWTYSEGNASRWRHLFDDLLGGTTSVEVPLEGNGKSLCSLCIRISDALKWLADQFRAGNPRHGALRPPEGPSALRSHRLSSPTAPQAAPQLPHHPAPSRTIPHHPAPSRTIPHLDPALRARLQSALQRPDLKPTIRAKIESALKQPETKCR